MEVDIYIDSLTDCLVCSATGKLHDTEYRLIRRLFQSMKRWN